MEVFLNYYLTLKLLNRAGSKKKATPFYLTEPKLGHQFGGLFIYNKALVNKTMLNKTRFILLELRIY